MDLSATDPLIRYVRIRNPYPSLHISTVVIAKTDRRAFINLQMVAHLLYPLSVMRAAMLALPPGSSKSRNVTVGF
jgi:hypothetical protein